jgi:hypothetical protein
VDNFISKRLIVNLLTHFTTFRSTSL